MHLVLDVSGICATEDINTVVLSNLALVTLSERFDQLDGVQCCCREILRRDFRVVDTVVTALVAILLVEILSKVGQNL
jgi:hypothetical protein